MVAAEQAWADAAVEALAWVQALCKEGEARTEELGSGCRSLAQGEELVWIRPGESGLEGPEPEALLAWFSLEQEELQVFGKLEYRPRL